MSDQSAQSCRQHVGEPCAHARICSSMSQEKLGEALGLTFQQVQKYEKGTNRVGASRIQQISESCNSRLVSVEVAPRSHRPRSTV